MSDPHHELMRLRGEAVNAYAWIEAAMCSLMATFGGMSWDTAATIFFKINNARARMEILDDLKKSAIGDRYKDFWKSSMLLVKSADQRRNEIVHWHVSRSVNISHGHGAFYNAKLRPGRIKPGSPEWHATSVYDFANEANYIGEALRVLNEILTGNQHTTNDQALLDICERELAYPPPRSNDPISQRLIGRQIPPPAWPG